MPCGHQVTHVAATANAITTNTALNLNPAGFGKGYILWHHSASKRWDGFPVSFLSGSLPARTPVVTVGQSKPQKPTNIQQESKEEAIGLTPWRVKSRVLSSAGMKRATSHLSVFSCVVCFFGQYLGLSCEPRSSPKSWLQATKALTAPSPLCEVVHTGHANHSRRFRCTRTIVPREPVLNTHAGGY